MSCFIAYCASVSFLALLTNGARALNFGDDSDLTSFVTRPEIKAPLMNITYKVDNKLTPGYWFVAPYSRLQQSMIPDSYYQPCSAGPLIYDNNGDLVWSGACKLRNQNSYDFRPYLDEHGDHRLSVLVLGYHDGYQDLATIMDSSYGLVHNFSAPVQEIKINMHEWNVINQGRSALYITHRSIYKDITALDVPTHQAGWMTEPGFREIDLETGDVLFEWWSAEHISALESSARPINLKELDGQGWNWFHANSVDKDENGHYLLSGRFTDTVYKIGQDGKIIWRLGGSQSSFHLDGFNFSKQHDARFLSNDGSTEIISLFDNGHALHPHLETPATSNTSSALIISLNKSEMTAKVIKRITRPDGKQTSLRGSFQSLPNGNSFICWAGHSYLSEHGPDGDLVLETTFERTRFVTYRGYKFNFTASPSEPPVLKAIAFGETPEASATEFYVSWIGATEVDTWVFYREGNYSSAGKPNLIGSSKRRGFETRFSSEGCETLVYAEAISHDGTFLGRTATEKVELPMEWVVENDEIEIPRLAHTDIRIQPGLESWRLKDEL